LIKSFLEGKTRWSSGCSVITTFLVRINLPNTGNIELLYETMVGSYDMMCLFHMGLVCMTVQLLHF